MSRGERDAVHAQEVCSFRFGFTESHFPRGDTVSQNISFSAGVGGKSYKSYSCASRVLHNN